MKTFILAIFFSVSAFAADNACLDFLCRDNACFTHSDKSYQQLVSACENSNVNCVESVCLYYGNCQMVNNATAIAKICKNNSDGVCINQGCSAIGTCGVLSEAEFVSNSCTGAPDNRCISDACVNRDCGMHTVWTAVVESCQIKN